MKTCVWRAIAAYINNDSGNDGSYYYQFCYCGYYRYYIFQSNGGSVKFMQLTWTITSLLKNDADYIVGHSYYTFTKV